MNQEQRKYARSRIDQICKDKLQAITETCKLETVVLTGAQKIDALRKGEFTIADRRNVDQWYCYQNIKFNKEKLDTQDKVLYDKLIKKLSSEKARVLDELYLGDETKALEAIQAFANFNVK